ncbi:hypothetical protein QBC34DRAFT_496900 [Podospora aff. communis PSN243]|uniref:Heterokaryon incompatibility domain-containing protein n=1 Tax=Podospora aff. communis PSN243 TaxID=3040156 RepID=A0AAV9GH89_9PEZI|nr:hypothetical protein QBC34DRAFT_496900 [Podospora aff. communis PSN243]
MQRTLFATLAFRLVEELRTTATFSKEDLAAYQEAAGYCRTPRWTPLMHLLEHEWFERVWVAQEVVLAAEARVMYGGVHHEWEHFAAGIAVLGSKSVLAGPLGWSDGPDGPLRRTQVRALHVRNLITLQDWRRKRVREGQLLPFKEVLSEARLLKAKEPKDKVFGIQGIVARNNAGSWTKPDYSAVISVADVYYGAAMRLIDEHGVLELLSHAGVGYAADNGGVEGLPSWVPDWSVSRLGVPLGYVGRSQTEYRAGGTEGGNTHRQVGRRLILRASLLDTVAELAPTFVDLNKYGIEELRSAAEAFDASRVLLMTSSLTADPYPYQLPKDSKEPFMSLDDVFWRLLIGDRTEADWPARDSARQLFDSFDRVARKVQTPGVENRTEPVGNDELERNMPGQRYAALMGRAWRGRRVAVTRRGYACLVPGGERKGDEIWLVAGAPTPFVFREAEATEGGGQSPRGDSYRDFAHLRANTNAFASILKFSVWLPEIPHLEDALFAHLEGTYRRWDELEPWGSGLSEAVGVLVCRGEMVTAWPTPSKHSTTVAKVYFTPSRSDTGDSVKDANGSGGEAQNHHQHRTPNHTLSTSTLTLRKEVDEGYTAFCVDLRCCAVPAADVPQLRPSGPREFAMTESIPGRPQDINPGRSTPDDKEKTWRVAGLRAKNFGVSAPSYTGRSCCWCRGPESGAQS